MRQLLRLLLYLAAGAVLLGPGVSAVYFESAVDCGYPASSVSDFVHFEKSQELLTEPSLGVCGWAFDAQQSRVDLCISCSFTPADKPTCQGGSQLRSSAAGQCVVQSADLRPGQQFAGRVFAVPAATTDCYPYSFKTTRVCGVDRTFPPGKVYGACDGVQVSRDLEGCAKLPGYDFYRGWQLPDALSWSLNDGTQWQAVAGGAGAQQQAARDMPLMAARCSATASCAAFQNTGNSTDLLYQLPTRANWRETGPSADYCAGIYTKSAPSTSCSRVSGYLFVPQYTLDTSASSDFSTPAGAGPCSSCGDSAALAVRCDSFGANGACAGFSNYHGLIIAAQAGGAGGPLLADQPLTRFTTSPCAGMFLRAGRAFPQEVEELDQLLCGELVYCTGQLRYSASGQSVGASTAAYYVDLAVDFLTDFAMPRGLLDASGGGLKQLPAVRSLTLRCLNGAAIAGGLPLAVVSLMPFLQELRLQSCALAGALAPELAQLRYLRVLDLGQNRLTGPLPPAWANLTLGYLNLSSNLLTGALPPAWQGILTPRAAPPPPPPPPLAASSSPSLSAAAPLRAQAGLLVADLSANRLTGAVDVGYIRGSCVARRLRVQLQGQPRRELMAALGDGGAPTFLLQYNPGVAAWSGRYEYAVADVHDLHAGGVNLCGAYRWSQRSPSTPTPSTALPMPPLTGPPQRPAPDGSGTLLSQVSSILNATPTTALPLSPAAEPPPRPPEG
ncbi:putative LRR receptor-like serine/threonine-protein kinase [Tetrabaena socialis]|uniref:Putative LRR receptor-like serine/threonine-protein kinase n=1 Tax=Tetrabaena socialis TaxID=47790 RepID=A0A2J8A505_9CHLO|nr:putative LRR receptor-like serine/threonine-protein kinase [Tetrabaena socialis]|eukprot:PNH07598.1 putative LRR receptor-like serine/threonine-protein kinase [Tetrabaena socialis]